MQVLKTGSKNFYQWINDVYTAIRIIDSLYDKRDFFETKFLSCRTMNYEPFRGSGYQDKDMKTYWLIKIDEVDIKINKCKKIIKDYESFNKLLSESERIVLDVILRHHKSMITLAKQMEVSRNRVYELKNGLINKFNTF